MRKFNTVFKEKQNESIKIHEDKILNEFKDVYAKLLENYNSKEVRILKAPCMGRCFAAPTVEIGHYHLDNADIIKIRDAVKNNKVKPVIMRER